jgi:hypothetical protein
MPSPRWDRVRWVRSPILKFFAFSHLPPHLQAISQPFAEAAEFVDTLPCGSDAARDEKAAALRKLLEAKDAAVRSQVP